jgi:hypothetical protein
MKTKIEKRDEYVPTALRQVWEWKDAIYQETKHLSTREALRYIHEQAAEVARQLNLRVASFPETAAGAEAKLAETPPPYDPKKQ